MDLDNSFHLLKRSLSFKDSFNLFAMHPSIVPLVTCVFFLYLSLTAFLNHDIKAPHLSSSSSSPSFLHEEKDAIYPQQWSPYRSHHDTWEFLWSSICTFRIRWQVSSATILKSDWHPAIKGCLHVDTWKSSHGDWIELYFCATCTFCIWQVLSCLAGEGRMTACTTGIEGYLFKHLYDWIHPLILMCTRGRIQIKPESNWLLGNREIVRNMSSVLTEWQASSSAQNTMPTQLFQAFQQWSWHVWIS